MTIYFISGLGADEKIFQNLRLPATFIIKHIHWIEPLKNETLQAYCRRLTLQMDVKDDFILAGLSFGGIAAIEINKIFPAKQVILISSISSRHELPLRYRLVRGINPHLWLPAWLMKNHNFILDWFFGIESHKEKKLLSSYMHTVSIQYLRWSLHQVLHWKNSDPPSNLLHIHGTKDRILPISNTNAHVRVEGGGHFMVFNKADVVSGIFGERLIVLS